MSTAVLIIKVQTEIPTAGIDPSKPHPRLLRLKRTPELAVSTAFCTSSNGAIYCGLAPPFANIVPVPLNMDSQKLGADRKRHTSASVSVPVLFSGLARAVRPRRKIAKTNNPTDIEDATHATSKNHTDSA